MTMVECLTCTKKFNKWAANIKIRPHHFCSRQCCTVWQTGRPLSKQHCSNVSAALKSRGVRPPTQKGRVGPLSGQWKGENVSYTGLHHWVTKNLGRPDTCEFCKQSGLKRYQIHWANKSHEYKRDLSDWIRLCVKCHTSYDKGLLPASALKQELKEMESDSLVEYLSEKV